MNCYGFVSNNPQSNVDRLGLSDLGLYDRPPDTDVLGNPDCKERSGFDLDIDILNVAVTLDGSKYDHDNRVITGTPFDVTDVYFRIRGSADVTISCYRKTRAPDGCCQTTRVGVRVSPLDFDITIAKRVRLIDPVTSIRALNQIRWAVYIAKGAGNLPELKKALEAKTDADALCRRLLPR